MDASNSTLKPARASSRSAGTRTRVQPRRSASTAVGSRRARARADEKALRPASAAATELDLDRVLETADQIDGDDAFGKPRAEMVLVPDGPLAERIRALLEARIEAMPHESFDDPDAAEAIVAPMPAAPETRAGRRSAAPEGVPPYLASLYDTPLLNREQEAHLFRKMNYLKYRAGKLRDALDPARASRGQVEEIEGLLEQATAVKNQIIRANLRLVVSIAKRHVSLTRSLFELVSDGNISLMRAVEKFDYARGNKFSTYATWAIKRNFSRSIPEEDRRRDRFVTGYEEMFEGAADLRSGESELEDAQRRARETVEGMLGKLDERERRILTSHYGLGGASEQTLEQLGKELGITKERVRQIESRAQDKLRKLASADRLDDLKIA